MPLLERDSPLALLREAFDGAADAGRIVLVGGEAGIGKTSLVEAFLEALPGATRILWGACEALSTPRPLGPLHDMAHELGDDVVRLLHADTDRQRLFGRFLETIDGGGAPVVVVIEDVHWADGATLDLVKYIGRRVHRLATLVVATWRSDEVGVAHPIRHLFGDLPARATLRIELPALSPEAVDRLAGRAARDLDEQTSGNPFYLTEVLAAGGQQVPPSIRDAVLSRAARLDEAARRVLDLVSIVPARTEHALVAALRHDAAAIEACLASGLLLGKDGAYRFRHELARLAVEEALTEPRRRTLHAAVFQVLASREGASYARLVHHAALAGDDNAVRDLAPEAARRAALVGAHGEAAANYWMALHRSGNLTPAQRADLLEKTSYECYLTGQTQQAFDTRESALAIWRALGNREKEGATLRWMSRLSWFLGNGADADRYGTEAIGVLESLPPGPELAMAWSNRAQLEMLADRADAARAWGEKAIELADRFTAVEIRVHALNNVGTARLLVGDADGRPQLEESLELAIVHDMHEHAARAWTNLGSMAVRSHDPRAVDVLTRGIEWTLDRDLDAWTLYMTGWRSLAHLRHGDWDAASDDARSVLSRAHVAGVSRIQALTALGTVRSRRGDTGAAELLEEAWAVARQTGEIQRIGPVALARAEHAWLNHRDDEARAILADAPGDAARPIDPWLLGELGALGIRLGLPAPPIERTDGPWRFELEGRWPEAAETWQALNCPWEEAWARARGGDTDVRNAHRILSALGSPPGVERLRRNLKESGAAVIPRGPYRRAAANPFGLTARQTEILAFLAEGATNPEIAERLFISVRTVDNHVGAILERLGARTRTEAVTEYLRQAGDPKIR
jgi:DNA-binding CsgD family transcriptional regulator/tetratricopeptide (TPR) repeat protein